MKNPGSPLPVGVIPDAERALQSVHAYLDLPLPGVHEKQIRVLSCEDLILLIIVAGRIIDRADVCELLRANRNALDWNVLRSRASDLPVREALEARTAGAQ
ncbi:MAG TPA: hypothetical protein PKD54_03375 [Pirellulaceae bacterium]|nr:hypothetical protein [Pirellulaceae bacterium]